jgi:uncharacterized protein with von Willebrand factor type A (vWA) domain
MSYRYSQWDGTQEVFPLNEEDVMDNLSEHLYTHGDLAHALRNLAWHGMTSRSGARLMGIQELVQRLKSRREEFLNKYDLSSLLDDIAKRLDGIIEMEREGIDRSLLESLSSDTEIEQIERQEQQAIKDKEFLNNLPADVGGRIKELSKYEFTDAEAQRQFKELMDMLKQRVLETYFKDLSNRLKELSPEELNRLREMVKQLNQMLEQRMRGEEPDFDGFMEQFGDYFGGQPANLDELMEQFADGMVQMESLLASLPEEMRESLRQTLNAALQDDELRKELSKLASAMGQIIPFDELINQYGFEGEEPVSLSESIKLMEQLQKMEGLEKQLRRARQGAGLEEIDTDQLQEILGEDAKRALDELKHLAEFLEEAGYLKKEGGRLKLTPKGIRRLGQKALKEIFRFLKKDRLGKHEAHHIGRSVDLGEGTKKYEFGDTFMVDLKKTLFNAVQRQGAGVPIRLEPDDLEVFRTEDMTQCSTVLMLDLSLSMAMRGSFIAAKRMAMALDNLMRTQYPRDRFYIVSFSTYARETKPDRLPYIGWDEFDPYTNIQHGLILAQKLLAKVKGGNKQILLVTDGEPTAHLEGGQLFLQYPPSYRTLEMTLREVKNCSRRGIVINTFMLDTNPFLMRFMSELARINRGRVFFTSPDKLGEYVLMDFISQKRKPIAL